MHIPALAQYDIVIFEIMYKKSSKFSLTAYRINMALYYASCWRIISNICAGVTTMGALGKCLRLPVTK